MGRLCRYLEEKMDLKDKIRFHLGELRRKSIYEA